MIDIMKLVDTFDLAEDTRQFPGFPGNFPGSQNRQDAELEDVSRISQISRLKSGFLGFGEKSRAETVEKDAGDRAREGVYKKTPGNPGKPGKDGLSDCFYSSLFFPVEEEEPGNAGKTEAPPASAPGPQPIPPGEVRALFKRTLADLERACPHEQPTVARAVSLIASRLHNDPRLSPVQTNNNHCWICGRPEGAVGFIAVLSAGPGKHYWMHSDCHAEHRRRMGEKVEECLRGADIESALS